ncbi:MAG TPA: nuclear transport factor 2 family protein [Pyrinomonadaceae bacterium]|jgi:uncharacterized protein YfcZ (UPF0381/DUF406 family)
MTETERKTLVENYIRAYNRFDIAGMIENLDDRIVFKNISNGETTLELEGLDAFRKQAEYGASLFSEREQIIEKITFTEEGCEMDIDYKAKLAADLPNGLRAGEKIRLKGKSKFRFAGSKIIEIQDIS